MTTIECSNPSLVLSGGGMKAAAFHIGVALALQTKGFSIGNAEDLHDNPLAFKRYVGTSAGSVIATFFAAGYSVEDIIFAFTQGDHNLDTLNLDSLEPSKKLPSLRYKDVFSINMSTPSPTKWIPNFFSDGFKGWGGVESLLKRAFKINGLFSTKGLGDYFRSAVLNAEFTNFEDLAADLFVVATYLNQPKKAVFSKYDLNDGIKSLRKDTVYITGVDVATSITASAALPPIFAPVTIEGEVFFDGEVRDSLSSHIALEQGSDLVIVSYSMQPYKMNEEFGSLDTYGLPVIANQALYQMIQHKIINHINSKEKLHGIFNSVEKSLLKQMPKEEVAKIIDPLEKEFFPDRKAKVLYIHPSAQDYEMFFADHLSLKPKILNQIVTVGFKAAMKSLRDYEFTGK
ncbi:MAG: patatin-like phospholipase family protein [Bdellovibrionales bacterium]